MPLTYSYWLFKKYFSIGWNPDCRKQYKISFKCTYRVRAFGAFFRNTYLACQQRPESKNLGDDMSATSCTTGTSSLFPITPLASSTASKLICWLWEGMWLLYCPHPHDENVLIFKKMCHMQAILVVSVSKQSAHYFFCYLAFGVIKTSLSKSWDKGFFTWETLSHHIQKSILSWIVFLSHHIYKSWDMPSLFACFFLSFFLYFRRPNLITGQSGWQVPDKVDFFLFFGKPRLNPQWIWSVMGKNILQCLWACHHLPNWPSYSTSMTLFLTRNFLTPSTQSNLFPILICFFLILIRIPFRKPI